MGEDGVLTVSVIIPCFNTGEFIEECVESVVGQDVPEMEVILVDDGSTEAATLSALERLAAKYRDHRLVRTRHHNVGQARNTGFAHSSGRFILFLDSDDTIGKDFLSATIRELEGRPDCGVAFTEVELFGLMSGMLQTGPLVFQGEIYFDNYLHPAAMVRREVIEASGGFNPNLVSYEDWDFWIKLHEAGVQFIKVCNVLAFYRRRGNSKLVQNRARRPYLINQLVLNHKEAYGQLFLCPIGDREGRNIRGLLRAASERPTDSNVWKLLRSTRVYRQFLCYSAMYRALRKLLAPMIIRRRD